MSKYHLHYQTRQTPQTQPIPGREQEMVQNNAGGYVFPVDDWVRLDHFLILGSEGGTYYVKEKELTIDNAQAVQRCIAADGQRVVNRALEISESGRAPKNDPALFVLAMCAGMGNLETRKAAYAVRNRIARIGTHHFQENVYEDAFRGWGRARREANANWYNEKDADRLAYQVIKYRQRHGYTHRDILRLAHPVPPDKAHKHLYHWITQGKVKKQTPELVQAFELAQVAQTEKTIVELIESCGLPWETIPTQFLKSPMVWESLLSNRALPMTAMIRNLGRMTNIDLLKPMSNATKLVTQSLTNQEALSKARIHPISVLIAMLTYQGGKGLRGSLRWSPVREIVDALDDAFYLSFGNVEPTGKNLVIAIDKSGSMSSTWSGFVAGVPGLFPYMAAAVMAMVTARVEKQYAVVAFDHRLLEANISPRQRLDDVMRAIPCDGGSTDASLPIKWAIKNKVIADAFLLLTDNETWSGNQHPAQALQVYRRKSGIPAKLISVGMTATGFTVADPNDAGQMDVVGFDTATPNLISDFVRNA